VEHPHHHDGPHRWEELAVVAVTGVADPDEQRMIVPWLLGGTPPYYCSLWALWVLQMKGLEGGGQEQELEQGMMKPQFLPWVVCFKDRLAQWC